MTRFVKNRGNWPIIAGTLGCLIIAGLLWIYLQPTEPDKAADQWLEQQQTNFRPGGADCDPRRLGRLDGREAANARERCEQAAEQHRIEKDDVHQQRRMATAAEDMNDLTYAQSRALAVQTAIIFLAFAAAVAAALYARRAATEAKRSSDATRDILETERKPFLTLRPVDAEQVRWNPRTGKVGLMRGRWFKDEQVFCVIKSSGRSPAILTEICRSWVVVQDYDSPPPIDPMGLIPKEALLKRMDIPVGSDGIVLATASDRRLKGSRNGAICFYGYMKFTDMTKVQEYVSGFYFRFQPRTLSRGLVTALPREEDDPHKYWYHWEVER